jgi:hypothetical protein
MGSPKSLRRFVCELWNLIPTILFVWIAAWRATFGLSVVGCRLNFASTTGDNVWQVYSENEMLQMRSALFFSARDV